MKETAQVSIFSNVKKKNRILTFSLSRSMQSPGADLQRRFLRGQEATVRWCQGLSGRRRRGQMSDHHHGYKNICECLIFVLIFYAVCSSALQTWRDDLQRWLVRRLHPPLRRTLRLPRWTGRTRLLTNHK